mgnify:CR=1 FL=1
MPRLCTICNLVLGWFLITDDCLISNMRPHSSPPIGYSLFFEYARKNSTLKQLKLNVDTKHNALNERGGFSLTKGEQMTIIGLSKVFGLNVTSKRDFANFL